MALIPIPASVGIRSIAWSQEQAFQTQRSAFTGHTRFAEIGTAHRWTADVTFAPMKQGAIRAFRAWMAQFLRPGNLTRIEMDGEPQLPTPPGALQVAVARFATQMPYSGATPSTLVAPAGGHASIAIVGNVNSRQTVTVIEDSVSDASGAGVIKFVQPLRAASVAGVQVWLHQPFVNMWPLDPMRWSVEPLPLYSAPTVTFEEAF